MKLPSFRSLKAKLATSDDVARALETNIAQLASARAELADMEAQRSGLLLDGDDQSVDAHEARLQDVRRLMARLEARSKALQDELVTAGAREADENLAKRIAEVKARADAAERWLRTKYPEAARTIAEGLAELGCAERAVWRLNEELGAAGRADEVVPSVERRVVDASTTPGSLTFNTALMELPGIAPAYGVVPLTYPWTYGTLGEIPRLQG